MNTIKKQLEQAHQEADASNRAWQAQYIDLEVRYQHLQKQLYLQASLFYFILHCNHADAAACSFINMCVH